MNHEHYACDDGALIPGAQATVPNSDAAALAEMLTTVFGALDATAMDELQAAITWRHLPGGTLLFRQGEPGDTLAVVVNGRLRITVAGPDGSERTVNELGRGSLVGELALLTGESRSATVRAARDTDVALVAQDLFLRLLQRHPQAMLQLARTAAHRTRQVLQVAPPPHGALTIAVVPCGAGAPLAAAAARLAEALATFGPTLHLSSAWLDQLLHRQPAAKTADFDDVDVRSWLSAQEEQYHVVIYEADHNWSPWTHRCVRHADRVLLVGHADDAPALGLVEQAMAAQDVNVRTDLVLIHPDDRGRPAGTHAWLALRSVLAHHHARLGYKRDFLRLARQLTGRTVGLVLSSGGARGHAHIGALRALEEAGIEVDQIGGTSMGALVGALYALGHRPDELTQIAASFSARRKLLDMTLPLTSFAAGRKVTELYRQLFGDVLIEDLWRPFFCTSSNLTRAEQVIHRDGALWKSVRASTAIPGIFAPVLHDGDVLIDGALINSLPLDIMRGLCERGTLIGINACPLREPSRSYNFGDSVSGWQVLFGRLAPWSHELRTPSLFGTLMRTIEVSSRARLKDPEFLRLADLLIQLPVEPFKMLDFDAHAAIIDVGYQSARRQIADWQRVRCAPLDRFDVKLANDRVMVG